MLVRTSVSYLNNNVLYIFEQMCILFRDGEDFQVTRCAQQDVCQCHVPEEVFGGAFSQTGMCQIGVLKVHLASWLHVLGACRS